MLLIEFFWVFKLSLLFKYNNIACRLEGQVWLENLRERRARV
jgi:hypothetical protein